MPEDGAMSPFTLTVLPMSGGRDVMNIGAHQAHKQFNRSTNKRFGIIYPNNAAWSIAVANCEQTLRNTLGVCEF
jgi:hypothetical protein